MTNSVRVLEHCTQERVLAKARVGTGLVDTKCSNLL